MAVAPATSLPLAPAPRLRPTTNYKLPTTYYQRQATNVFSRSPATSSVRVSFIIPLYNCLPLTQQMLASLQATLPAGLEHEIIFVDDGSMDGTRSWLQNLDTDARRSPFRIVLNERNLGYAAANNRGAAVARGEFLALLNNDLVLTPGWLEPMLAAFVTLPAAGIVGNVQLDAGTGAVDHTGIFINAKGKPQHDRELPAFAGQLKQTVAVTGACLLIRRALWIQLRGFDEGFVNGCEDVDLCLRARAAGHASVVALRSIVRHHVSSSPGRKQRDEQNTRRLAERWRSELIELGARAWCREFLARELNAATAFADPLDAAAIAVHAGGLSSRPPASALAGMNTSLDREFARWRELLHS
jgi:O-antigen biosynthesis protein